MSEEVDHADMMEEAWERLQRLSHRIQHRFQLKQKMDAGKQYAVDHPFATLFVLVTLAMCAVPMMCFTAFAIGTLLLTFLGFMFVEGLVLTAGSVVLGGILAVLAFISAMISAGLVAVWLVFMGSRQIMAFGNVKIPFLSRFGFGQTTDSEEEEPPVYEENDPTEFEKETTGDCAQDNGIKSQIISDSKEE